MRLLQSYVTELGFEPRYFGVQSLQCAFRKMPCPHFSFLSVSWNRRKALLSEFLSWYEFDDVSSSCKSDYSFGFAWREMVMFLM